MTLSLAEFIKHKPLDRSTLQRFHEGIKELLAQVEHGLMFAAEPEQYLTQNVDKTLARLLEGLRQTYGAGHQTLSALEVPTLRRGLLAIGTHLRSDIEAALTNDPATTDPLEVFCCYPGFKAVAAHRVAHAFYQLGLPLLPRLISEFAHQTTGIDIHPGAKIGSHFFIDHGSGVVIGATAVIGDHVTLYQGVTLGAKRFQRDEHGTVVKGQPRHPILADHVTVYAGAAILGRITIGAGSVIGGNVWLTESVPANSRISQQHYLTGYYKDGDGI